MLQSLPRATRLRSSVLTARLVSSLTKMSVTQTQSRLLSTSRAVFNSPKPYEAARDEFLRKRDANMKKLGVSEEEYRELFSKARKQRRQKDVNSTILYGLSVIVAFLGLSYLAVPVYRIVCQQMGWGGQITPGGNMKTGDYENPRFAADRLKPIEQGRQIRITFSGDVSGILPWDFRPQQREVSVIPGETALCFYKAKNRTDKDIIGMATYTVTPALASQYFNKIQCFCFEEQQLLAGEEVDMPVFFFIDPDYATDPNLRGISDIVLHYTFFRAKYNDDGVLSPVATAYASEQELASQLQITKEVEAQEAQEAAQSAQAA